jgi:hypothetical protein
MGLLIFPPGLGFIGGYIQPPLPYYAHRVSHRQGWHQQTMRHLIGLSAGTMSHAPHARAGAGPALPYKLREAILPPRHGHTLA